jgi:hypothetical protein
MCPSLAYERLDGFYSYAVFRRLFILGRCPVNLNIPALKIENLQIGPKIQNGDFLENNWHDFD